MCEVANLIDKLLDSEDDWCANEGWLKHNKTKISICFLPLTNFKLATFYYEHHKHLINDRELLNLKLNCLDYLALVRKSELMYKKLHVKYNHKKLAENTILEYLKNKEGNQDA
jgi:hypothetical protein